MFLDSNYGGCNLLAGIRNVIYFYVIVIFWAYVYDILFYKKKYICDKSRIE